MQKVKHFSSQTEAHLAANYLGSHGVHAEVLGAKEYTSHVLGGDLGRYDLLVEDEVFGKANDLLEALEKSADGIRSEVGAQNYLKKAVFFAIGAMLILPVIFNYVSLKNLSLYLKTQTHAGKRWLTTVLVVFLQIPALVIWWKIIKDFFAVAI